MSLSGWFMIGWLLGFDPVCLHLLPIEIHRQHPMFCQWEGFDVGLNMRCAVRAGDAWSEGNLGFDGRVGKIPQPRHKAWLNAIVMHLERPQQHVGIVDAEQ